MNAVDKEFARSRFAVYVKCGAVSLGCGEQSYIETYGCGWSAARRAIKDARDRVAGAFPRDGLTDDQRYQIACLENEASFCPATFPGRIKQQELRARAAIIRDAARRHVP